jgi:hypothetical protein
MLPGVFPLPTFAQAFALTKFIDIIVALGLSANLRLCLDAGDADSYTSGQSWLDRSGNGYDFFRGATNSATTDDPAFNGSAGGLSASEYFSFDGGDYFRYDTTNETWMQNLHKNNAAWTWCAWVRITNTATVRSFFGSNGGAQTTGTGVHIVANASENLSVRCVNSNSLVLQADSTLAIPTAQWTFAGISFNEAAGAGGSFFYCDGTGETFDGTYSSPSSGNASQTFEIGARGNGNGPLASGERMAGFMMWDAALSQANLTAIYNATRSRYGV